MSELPDLPRYSLAERPRRRLARIVAVGLAMVAVVAAGWSLLRAGSPEPQADPAAATQTMLRNALEVAGDYYGQNDTMLGFSASKAHRIEPSITFNRSAEASTGQVSIRDIGPSTVLLVSMDGEGASWCAAKTLLGNSLGQGDVGTAVECEGGW